MSKKSHLYFRNPIEGQARFRQKARGGDFMNDAPEEEKVVKLNIDSLRNSLKGFRDGKAYRTANKNLNIDLDIDYIAIEFYDTFNAKDFTLSYRKDFGVYPIAFHNANTSGFFVIVEENKFYAFLEQIEKIIYNNGDIDYNPNIKFIKSFKYKDIGFEIQNLEKKSFYALDLVDNAELFESVILPQKNQLLKYLYNKKTGIIDNIEFNRIELFDVTFEIINEIARNFDIIQSITAHDSGIIRPSLFKTAIRSFGFEVQIPNDLPIIGIIDTGISNLTPLNSLIINNGSEFDFTNTRPTVDNVNHGTGVAALAAFGNKLYPEVRGVVESDAKLLSIKVLDQSSGCLPDKIVVDSIRQANKQYGIKLFNLSIGYTDSKRENEAISTYAYMLDSLTYELDVLIFISTGNNITGDYIIMDERGNLSLMTYPSQFSLPSAIIKSPAESMNNITIGASSGNFELFDAANSISLDKNSPAYYSCRHHVNRTTFSRTINNQITKPDLINYGGDYDIYQDHSSLGIRLLSSEVGEFYYRHVGSSYSTPLTCNIGARLLKIYPSLYHNMQSLKALLINSASNEKFIEEGLLIVKNVCKCDQILGRGIPATEDCLYSSESKATILLEDQIEMGNLQTYPLNLPAYLRELPKKHILHITATLCFRFKPISNNDLAYCPLHIAFGFFKNLQCEEKRTINEGQVLKQIDVGINGNTADHVKIGNNLWSEDYYYKSKPLSNVQKINFSVSKDKIINENGTFKIGISSCFNKLLTDVEKQNYRGEHPFSLAITIEDKAKTGRLYDGLIAENNLQLISEIDAQAEIGQLDLFGDI